MARPVKTLGKINRYGMNMPALARGTGAPIIITPVVNAQGPMMIIDTLEDRLSSGRLMWFLEKVVSPYMGNVMVERFAYAGDKAVGGPWPPLADYTERLKRTLGAPADAPNERSGDMLHHLVYDHAVEPWGLGAELRIPDKSDGLMEKKIRTAQEGESGSGFAGTSYTPPRPVLGIGDTEEQVINKMFDSYLWASL